MWFLAMWLFALCLLLIVNYEKEINEFESRCRKAVRYIFRNETVYPLETEAQKQARFDSGVQAANELYKNGW